MRSILGECTGNVRSTPTPKDCFRTVKVSRTPSPWRLMTTPSKTCVRRRVPSMTWKWTRTRSPEAKVGTRRSWERSRVSITVLMTDAPAAVLRRAGVVRVLRVAAERGAEGLLDRGLRVAERAGELAQDRVAHDHGGQLAAGEHVAPDRDGVAGEMLDDALVEALVAAAQQCDGRLGGQLVDEAVVEHPAARRQR